MTMPLRPLGLYIHIPFCKQKCTYCDFYSLAGREDRMDAYTQALCAHLALEAPRAAIHTVDSVYFGGGTPSCLGDARLVRILQTVRECYRLSPDTEITLEANPDSAGDVSALGRLRQAGFNRLSLGMQSACDQELRHIGRIHTASQTRAAVGAARAAGFDNLSLDLIYGLPHQTMDRWQANLTAAADLGPEHLSCYGLKVEEGTPLYARRADADLPDDEAQADFYLWTVEYLSQRGYEQYEISNFAKAGRRSRHNLKYWRLQEYLGFGPGAHSDFGGERFAYSRSLEDYIRGAASGALTFSEHRAIPARERAEEWVMLGLRTAEGLDSEVFEGRFRRPFAPCLPFLDRCRSCGYAVEEGGRWHLTPRGFLVSNRIIGELIELLDIDG